MRRHAEGLWFTGPRQAELRKEALPAVADGEVRVETLHSGVSRGTERLVFEGRVPPSEHERMRAPFQGGTFPFPVKYGYASVGRVVEGPDALRGATVFCLHPHQTAYVVPAAAVVPVPDRVPPGRAVLAANMETAVNAIWDADLRAGDRVCVVGAGVVGALVAYLAVRHPGTEVTIVDVNPRRAATASDLGARFASPADAPSDADVVFHASGSARGLPTALDAAGLEGRIIELSWHGTDAVTLPLGGAFHAKRLHLRSSQVGRLPPSQAPRWTPARRLQLALSLLVDGALDALITSESPFAEAPTRLEALLADDADALCHRFNYA